MSRDVHDIIDSTEQPHVVVFVEVCAIAGEILVTKHRPVGLFEPLVIPPNSSEHGGPRFGDDQQSATFRANFLTVLGEDVHRDSREGNLGTSRLRGGHTG